MLSESTFNDVQETLGMRGNVLNGNFLLSRLHEKKIINLGDYKFCACIYFLMGRRSVIPCGTEKHEFRREYIQGTHMIKHSYGK